MKPGLQIFSMPTGQGVTMGSSRAMNKPAVNLCGKTLINQASCRKTSRCEGGFGAKNKGKGCFIFSKSLIGGAYETPLQMKLELKLGGPRDIRWRCKNSSSPLLFWGLLWLSRPAKAKPKVKPLTKRKSRRAAPRRLTRQKPQIRLREVVALWTKPLANRLP